MEQKTDCELSEQLISVFIAELLGSAKSAHLVKKNYITKCE